MRMTTLGLLVVAIAAPLRAQTPLVSFESSENELLIQIDGTAVTTYAYHDPLIPRPYFAQVKLPDGRQVTRNHPPVEGVDPTDHATMHPGIWMAFGDLDGNDYWRNKASIQHVRFIQPPKADAGSGSFIERKHYLRADGSMLCQEDFQWQILVRPIGYLMTWDSTFRCDSEIYFGDQEEMGLGLRVATALSETHGGQLRDSQGRVGAKSIWSQSADWCDCSGEVEGQRLGMAIFCDPGNFRASWMHARDYGFVAANPFGRHAMHKGEVSKVWLKPGEALRLRYAIWVHSGDASQASIETEYRRYLKLLIDAN